MFYDQKLLCFTTDFGKVWLVANLGIEKVNKDELNAINIIKLCAEIRDYLTTKSLNVKDRLSLKLAATLVYGTVRIFCFQVDTLIIKLNKWFIEVTTQIVLIKERTKSKGPHVRVRIKGERKKKVELTPTVDNDLGPSVAKNARPLDMDEIQIMEHDDIQRLEANLEDLLEQRRGDSHTISFTEPTGPQATEWPLNFGDHPEIILEHMDSRGIPVVSSIPVFDSSSPPIAPEEIFTAVQVHVEASPRILPVPESEKGNVEEVSPKRASRRRTKVPEVIETGAQEHAEGSPKSLRSISQAVGDKGQALEKPSSTRKSAKKQHIKVKWITEKSRCFANICRCPPREGFYIDKTVCVDEECLIVNNVFRDRFRVAEDLGMSDFQQRGQSDSISQSRATPQGSLRRTKHGSSGTPQPSSKESTLEPIRVIQSGEFRDVSKEVSRDLVPQEQLLDPALPQPVFPETSVQEPVLPLPEAHIQEPPLDEMNLEQVVLDQPLPLNTIINQLTNSQKEILNIIRNHDFDIKDLTIKDVTDGHVINKLTIAKAFFDILVLTKHKLIVPETEEGSTELKRIIKGPKFF